MKMSNAIPIIEPVYPEAVTIHLSTDDEYALYCGVTLYSIIHHASLERHYDIVIVTDSLTPENRDLLVGMSRGHENISIRIVSLTNVEEMGFRGRGRFSDAAWFRIAIPELFQRYEKVLYLDVDLVILTDVAELYDNELGECQIAACHDYGLMYLDLLHHEDGYFAKLLGVPDPIMYYFNSGVLLYNIRECRKGEVFQCSLKEIASQSFMYLDQDVLNKVCFGRVHYLDAAWNYTCPVPEELVPPGLYGAHAQAQKNPKIVHYVTKKKPWCRAAFKEGYRWWYYARMTPFYDKMLYRYHAQVEARQIELEQLIYHVAHVSMYRRRYRFWRLLSHLSFGKIKQYSSQKKRLYCEKYMQVVHFLEKLPNGI